MLPLLLLLKNAPKKTFGHTNQSQGSPMTSNLKPKLMQNITFVAKWAMCVSKRPKIYKYKKGTHFRVFFESKKRSDFFLELYLLLSDSMLFSQERSQGDIWTHKCTPRLPNEFQNEAKMNTKHYLLPKLAMCAPHSKYHVFLHVGQS